MATCQVCFRHCQLREGQTGFCGARICTDGSVRAENYGRITALALDPIEKKPFRRFHPGTMILSLGSYGCNLRCPFCQNHEISMVGPGELNTASLTPETLAGEAERLRFQGNIGLAYTYNEPIIWWEFMDEIAILAREKKIKNVLVLATGALFSPILLYQKENINSICHAISLEVV